MKNNSTNNLVAVFLRSFWKGITLPFPALRGIVVAPSSGNRNRKMAIGLSFKEGLLSLVAYFLVGLVAYTSVLEKWSISDALYFTCVTFSTVGYGDLCPTNPASKIFTCLFGLGGIAWLGAAVATVGSKFVQAEMKMIQKSRQGSRKRLERLFEGMPRVLQRHRGKDRKDRLEALRIARENVEKELEVKLQWPSVVKNTFLRVLPSLAIIFGGGYIMQRLNGNTWAISDVAYFSLITASTIGFGDIGPQTRAARLFAIAYIPLSVAAAGEILSGIAMSLVQRRQRDVYARQLEKDLTIQHLRAMDVNQDGVISREEYVQFMLLEMGRITVEELDELSQQFERLDVTRSGVLDRDDLALMAELRGAIVEGLEAEESEWS